MLCPISFSSILLTTSLYRLCGFQSINQSKVYAEHSISRFQTNESQSVDHNVAVQWVIGAMKIINTFLNSNVHSRTIGRLSLAFRHFFSASSSEEQIYYLPFFHIIIIIMFGRRSVVFWPRSIAGGHSFEHINASTVTISIPI